MKKPQKLKITIRVLPEDFRFLERKAEELGWTVSKVAQRVFERGASAEKSFSTIGARELQRKEKLAEQAKLQEEAEQREAFRKAEPERFAFEESQKNSRHPISWEEHCFSMLSEEEKKARWEKLAEKWEAQHPILAEAKRVYQSKLKLAREQGEPFNEKEENRAYRKALILDLRETLKKEELRAEWEGSRLKLALLEKEEQEEEAQRAQIGSI